MVTGGAKIGGRALKRKVRSLLGGPDLDSALAQIRRLPPRQVVNPLFSFFCSLDPTLKWRAVSAMGVVVANLAAGEDEFARVVMRRLMWSLNDESGGIGWGAPEAMGEIMARSRTLADEFGTILLSYLQPQGNNYLEHALLQRGPSGAWAGWRMSTHCGSGRLHPPCCPFWVRRTLFTAAWRPGRQAPSHGTGSGSR